LLGIPPYHPEAEQPAAQAAEFHSEIGTLSEMMWQRPTSNPSKFVWKNPENSSRFLEIPRMMKMVEQQNISFIYVNIDQSLGITHQSSSNCKLN
jgi:hypothetical protein